jgi:hypothetical protein
MVLVSERVGRVSEVPESVGQESAAAKDARLDRAHRDPQDLGGGLQGESLGVAEDHRGAEMGRDGRQGGFEVGPQLGRLEGGGGALVDGPPLVGQGLGRLPTASAGLVVAGIHRDPI